MRYPPTTREECFAAIAQALLDDPDVTQAADVTQAPPRFGSTALKVKQKIFAMLVQGKLVVKLPRQRVDALIGAGVGERFSPGHGRLMKEWVTVEPTSAEELLPLVREALEFVAANR